MLSPSHTTCAKTGRPTAVDLNRILDEAETLFAEKGFEGTTTREVVRRARCNLALISYHFGGKEGLYERVLVRYFERMRARYAEVDFSEATLEREWPELKCPAQRLLCATFHEMARKITTDSPVQKILTREMMTGQKRMIAALSRNEGGLYQALSSRIQQLQQQGKISRELDPRLGYVSLAGPIIYSCIAAPLLTGVYGFRAIDESYVRKLCLHQTRTFFAGWGT